MTNVEFMTRDQLEVEVLELRHKLSEMTTREINWLVEIGMPKQLERIFKFLEFNRGRLCSIVSIHEAMYDTEPESIDKSVQVQICNLRRRLKAANASIEIRMHWGKGYSLHDIKNEGISHDT